MANYTTTLTPGGQPMRQAERASGNPDNILAVDNIFIDNGTSSNGTLSLDNLNMIRLLQAGNCSIDGPDYYTEITDEASQIAKLYGGQSVLMQYGGDEETALLIGRVQEKFFLPNTANAWGGTGSGTQASVTTLTYNVSGVRSTYNVIQMIGNSNATASYAQWQWQFPFGFSPSLGYMAANARYSDQILAEVQWVPLTTFAGTYYVRFGIDIALMDDGDSLNPSYSFEGLAADQCQSLSVLHTTKHLLSTPSGASGRRDGPFAAVRLYRDPTNANDTYTGDVAVLGLNIRYINFKQSGIV